ncbi:MAG: 50S ribosomal protein L19 [Chlamydiae bacterium]|nr:50S ribosomal protein L19 [Chlamydiota bacterium]
MIEQYESKFKNPKVPQFKIGDTVDVHVRILEGDKERTQVFTGVVIAKKGNGPSATFTVFRNAYGCTMERVFLTHSPRLSKVEVVRSNKVRRAKLYYLTSATGKSAKLKEQFGVEEIAPEENASVSAQ